MLTIEKLETLVKTTENIYYVNGYMDGLLKREPLLAAKYLNNLRMLVEQYEDIVSSEGKDK